MTGQEIITKFELYVDDGTELSSTEELELLQEKYRTLCADRPWEFLKAEASGSLSTSLPYVSLPANFRYILANHSDDANPDAGAEPVVFVGPGYRPYQIVSWSNRRRYRDQDGYVYIDVANLRLYFTKQPTSEDPYEFDYMSAPTDIELNTEPLMPEEFHPILYYDMAIDDDIIQRFEKARSYAPENQAKRTALFNSLTYWNAQHTQ